MSHQYRLNPITGKLDMTGLSDSEIAELKDEETAEFEPNVKEIEWLGKPTTGKTAMQILHDLLVKDIPPSVALSSDTDAGTYEEGTVLAARFTARPTQGTFSIASMTLKITNASGKTIYTEIANAPEPDEDYTFTFNGDITAKSNVQVSIIDSAGLTDESKKFTYTFGNYMYIGFADEIVLEEGESIDSVITSLWLNSNLQHKILKTSYVTNEDTYKMPKDNTTGNPKSGYLYIAMPTAWGCYVENIYQSSINAYGFVSCLGDIAGYTNESGATVSYRIFRSNKEQIGDVSFYIKK